MNETPECPYCGEEMELHHIPDGLWWYQCGCCGAIAPSDETPAQALADALRRVQPCASCQQLSKALCGKENTTLKELLNAVEQLKRRAEPENRVLTVEEATGSEDPVWLETRKTLMIMDVCIAADSRYAEAYTIGSRIPYLLLLDSYGKLWRCWPRKPTPEQMAAEKWEE